ncbi:MAG: FUSC family protein [Candidatus Kaistia colombiensis]|nr:MAG: FUSC family protein [Kaistia sp.]
MHYKPANWLVNLTRLNPKTSWPWRHSIRLAVAVTFPMLVGLLVGQAEPAIMVSLGALLNSVKVQTEAYRLRFRNFLIVVPIAMLGYMLGALASGYGPLTFGLLIFVSMLSGLISGYGAAFSTAAMQMLMLAVIAAAGHPAASFWQPAVLFAAGAAFAALLLAVEAVFDRHHPERMALAQLLRSLAHLARTAASPPPASPGHALATPFEQQRRHVTDAMMKAYSGLLETRLRSEGRTPDGDDRAAILSTTGMIFSALLAGGSPPAELRAVGQRLDAIATAVAKGRARPSGPDGSSGGTRLSDGLDRLVEEIWPDTARSDPPGTSNARRGRTAAQRPPIDWRSQLGQIGRLAPGRDVIVSALKLSLCLAVAFAAQSLLGGVRSYWIPLCVVIVLKPDFGSVFVRAVQRSIGTILGVAIGVVILTFVPKGIWLLASMAVLGVLVPGAGQRGYAMQCAFLTPLVLILIDMPVPGTVDFGPQRLVDTLIGSGIVLVFGYLIWPRDPAPRILGSFSRAMEAAGKFLRAACTPPPADAAQMPAARLAVLGASTAAYRSLSNVRATLQRALAEPPPACREAAAWFPAVVEAERLCDRITRLAELNLAGAVTLDPAGVERRLAGFEALRTAALGHGPKVPGDPVPPRADRDPAFQDVDFELARLSQLMQPAT